MIRFYMYPLIKKINIDLIKEIYHYNNYSKLDMEWFRYNHRKKYFNVLIDIELMRRWQTFNCVKHLGADRRRNSAARCLYANSTVFADENINFISPPSSTVINGKLKFD